MFECKNCGCIDIECNDAGERIVNGQEAFVEELECTNCEATGRTVEKGGIATTRGSIRHY